MCLGLVGISSEKLYLNSVVNNHMYYVFNFSFGLKFAYPNFCVMNEFVSLGVTSFYDRQFPSIFLLL